MLDVISKSEYFTWLEEGIVKGLGGDLKHIQDAYILSRLGGVRDKRILEIGGGNSRVLPTLSRNNECWNVDRFEGYGAGPTEILKQDDITLVKTFMGEFDSRIPDDYFDYVFSISVVEHVAAENLNNFFGDCDRILNRDGLLLHAIDIYLFDQLDWDLPFAKNSQARISEYLKLEHPILTDLRFRQVPVIDKNLGFSCSYATNPDSAMHLWNRIAPQLKEIRARAQVVSLKSEWVKRDHSG